MTNNEEITEQRNEQRSRKEKQTEQVNVAHTGEKTEKDNLNPRKSQTGNRAVYTECEHEWA